MPKKPKRPGNHVDILCAMFGGQQALADAAGVSQSAVAEWKKKEIIPSPRYPDIVSAGRKLGITVTSEHLTGIKAAA